MLKRRSDDTRSLRSNFLSLLKKTETTVVVVVVDISPPEFTVVAVVVVVVTRVIKSIPFEINK